MILWQVLFVILLAEIPFLVVLVTNTGTMDRRASTSDHRSDLSVTQSFTGRKTEKTKTNSTDNFDYKTNKRSTRLGMVAHTFNPGTELGVVNPCELKTSLVYMAGILGRRGLHCCLGHGKKNQ